MFNDFESIKAYYFSQNAKRKMRKIKVLFV